MLLVSSVLRLLCSLQLSNLVLLNVSHNKLRSLPQSLGDMIGLCHLYLDHNLIRQLPYELGKLHRLVTLGESLFSTSISIVCAGLRGNNLVGEIAKLAQEPASTSKVIQYLLDHLASAFMCLVGSSF